MCATAKYYYQTQVWSLPQLVNIGRVAQDLLYKNHLTLWSLVLLDFFHNVFSDISTTWSWTRSWSSLVTWFGRSSPLRWSSLCWAWYVADLSLIFSLSTCHGVKISQSHTPRFGTVLPVWYLADLSSKCNWSFFTILMKWHCYNVTLLGLVPCITLITTLYYLRVTMSQYHIVVM